MHTTVCITKRLNRYIHYLETMKKEDIKYYVLYYSAYAFSLLPMWVLYRFSDFTFFIIYYLTRYRKKVVRKNLRNSFPGMEEKQLLKIEKDFFKWFCDYIFETIKLTSISKEEMMRRMQFEGMEEVSRLVSEGKSISVYLGHYCNWEWVSSFPMHLQGCLAGQIYHELESKTADKFFRTIRGRFGATSIKMEDTLTTVGQWQKEGKVNLVGYISDQVPGFSSMHYWPTFLNQQTPTYSGTERIAKIFSTAVFYMDIKRPKRGYYVATMVKMTENAKDEPKFSLTERYYRLLEETIVNNPPYWLWSHNRWKRTWEDFCNYFPDEKERKRILSKL